MKELDFTRKFFDICIFYSVGGFKATPGSGDLFAHTIANDEPHKLNAAFNINRFVSGDLVDEHGAAAVAH